MTKSAKFKLTPVSAAVTSALLAGATQSTAVAQEEIEEIITVGIRSSMQTNMNIKRNSVGVVDAITAEDIGRWPDTNLAESLQRIPGVSIDRVNGEGSKITVRGFGPEFNLITLNGRTLPTATIGIMGQRDNYTGGQGRSFGFENIASEGIAGLEIFKTGQAILPTGGLGATVNIRTFRPLDTPDAKGSIGVKAIADTSVGDGDSITPEISGLYNWVNDSESFGIGVFGAYSERDSGAVAGQANDWIVRRYPDSIGSYLRGDGSTQVINEPSDGELYAIPQDSRYDWSNVERERLNAQLVMQFRPSDNLTLTADYTFVETSQTELRAEQTNWFATPMDILEFDGGSPVNQVTFMSENNDGTKDIGYEQTHRATKESLNSLGLNLAWGLNDISTITLDGHVSKGEALPDNPLGHTSTFVTFGAPIISNHSVDWSQQFPIQSWDFDDSGKGNGNGILDVGDLATQVQRSATRQQTMDVNELDLRYTMDADDGRLDFGVNYRDTEVEYAYSQTQQDLGTWGMANPGDVDALAPGIAEAYCLACQFNDFPVGNAQTAFRADAATLFPIFQEAYSGNAISENNSLNKVEEDILSVYAQFEINTEFLGLPFQVVGGLRYAQTEVDASALQAVPTEIVWTADNDFVTNYAAEPEFVDGKGDYSHVLPNLDIRLDITDDLVARLSYSQTIGRAQYTSLFASTTAETPNRPTALGGQNSGSSQNPGLLPLESENFDLSVEYYYGDDSYVSLGFYDKTVNNFLGQGVFERPLFGLLDPTSGAPGSRSGNALDVIDTLGVDQSEAHLFTLVALIDANGGDVGAAQAEFEANLDPVTNTLPQSYVDDILTQYDVVGDANDPEMIFSVTQPINDREADVWGYEFAVQHFFGDSGFGFAANYTVVEGDVEADPGQDPNENVFNLVGLSDTANVTLIYENYGWSARLAYNWRDKFLNAANVSGSRDPQYTDAFGQLDMAVTWDMNDNLQFSFEGINLTGENTVQYRRRENMIVWAYELEPRYTFGARYRF
jgi:TonB-dependent receptor